MDHAKLKSVIESLLFVSNRPLSVKDLVKLLEQQAFAVQSALDELVSERKTAGIVVLENNGQYQLSTNAENSTLVKDFLNADLREKLTDATVEVLAIIAYRQPISKAEIEAIRGVNSQYSIRHLLMRGIIEKVSNPNDARSVYYQTTTEFLQHLGLVSTKDLPEFEKLVENIKLPESPSIAEHTELEQAEPGTVEVVEDVAAEEQSEPPEILIENQ